MPPIPTAALKNWLNQKIKSSIVLLFSKTSCPYCSEVKEALKDSNIRYATVELDNHHNGTAIQAALAEITGQKTVPSMFVRGNHIGDSKATLALHKNGGLLEAVLNKRYDYDLVVVGGGSGGLAASKDASRYGAKVAVLDYVSPTPQGTAWGLGGTCVNVGCIPKKLMHQAGLLGEALRDAESYGWEVPQNPRHNWTKLVMGVQDYIKSLNFGYRVALRDLDVTYLNARGEFVDQHTIKATDKNGKTQTITCERFILATGERPRYPGIAGDRELGITSDDLFSLPHAPGKTLVVGASYVALECAGFLTSLGMDVTVMVRSIFLRGFDQQMAGLVGKYMEQHGTKFVSGCVPQQIRRVEDGKPGLVEVKGNFVQSGQTFVDKFNTVIWAIGRDPCTENIGLQNVGVQLDKSGRVVCDDEEHSSVDNIHAIGDIVSGKPQLTPIAIAAGRNLARRLYSAGDELTDYINVPTAVFTPLEYSCIGYTEEAAIEKYGEHSIEVYHNFYKPLEWTVAHREDNVCYVKLICLRNERNRVIGIHLIGPGTAEVIQSLTFAVRLGITKDDFDATIGLHPTCAEAFTYLKVTKGSGNDPKQLGC